MENTETRTVRPLEINRVYFMHLRRYDSAGHVSGKGGTTIAYRQAANGTIEYAAAYCHPRDNYNKHEGRAKSAGRLNSDRHRSVSPLDVQAFRDVMYYNYGE